MIEFKISLEEEVLALIEKHGEEAFPNECCGFLFGKDQDERQVTLATPVNNVKKGDQKRRFEISPIDYMKAEQFALEKNFQLLGVYHSHPNHPAIASEHDLAVAMPFFSYAIVSVVDGKAADLKSWRLQESEEKKFQEEFVFKTANRI